MTRPVVVALHGVGSTAAQLDLVLRPLQSVAEVISLAGPHPFEGGGTGRQWFSVAGVTEQNRPARTAAALVALLPRLDAIAAARNIDRNELVLLGFSQGAIVTLGAVASGAHSGAAIAIAGRLANPVASVTKRPASVLLVHDLNDPVMPAELASAASSELASAGHCVERAFTTRVGHSIGAETLTVVADWLRAQGR